VQKAAWAMGVGAFGVASRVALKELLQGLRQWVKHACYEGSRMAAYEPMMCVGNIPWIADPVMQALIRPADFLAHTLFHEYHTCADLEYIWQVGTRSEGPVAALRAACNAADIQGDLHRWCKTGHPWGALDSPLEVDPHTRGRLLRKAREIQDLQGLEARNTKYKGVASVLDSEGTKRMRRGLGLGPDRMAALIGAQCGDVAVNAQARYWNGGKAGCPCGADVETRQHLFWECPRWESMRMQIRSNRGNPQMGNMAALTAEFGLCTWLPEVRAWWRSLVVTRPGMQMVLGAVYTDGSGLFPKDPQIRVASWSVVWRTSDGVWHAASGICTHPAHGGQGGG
jgi:hypothetical protein